MNTLLKQWTRSSSYQVGTLFVALIFLGLLFAWFWTLIGSNDWLLAEPKNTVKAELRGLIALRNESTSTRLLNEVFLRGTQQDNGFFYAVTDENGQFVGGNLREWPQSVKQNVDRGTIHFEVPHSDLPDIAGSRFPFSNHFDITAQMHQFLSGETLLVGRDIDDLEVAQYVATSLGWAVIAVLLAICGLSFGVAYYVASRFDRMSQTTAEIMRTGNLSRRLFVDSSWDDLSRYATLLNSMLRELEFRVDGIRSVADNIAHDLRTPLMRLRSSIDEHTSTEAKEILLDDLDRVLHDFQSLLRISSIEAGKDTLEVAELDVGTLCDDAVSMYEPIATDKNISIKGEVSPVTIAGDRDLLFQAIANVIDNAVKFTPPYGAVSYSIKKHEHNAVITVSDTGPGIPPQLRARAIERFSRLDTSRSVSGNGLGLPLAVAIVRRHSGDLFLSHPRKGTGLSVEINLPLAPAR